MAKQHNPWGWDVTARVLAAAPIAGGLVVLAAVWNAGRAANAGPLGFRLDDAWIHLVYGRGLLENGFLAYVDGEPSTGCTSPLWALCLAAVHAVAGPGVDSIVRGVLVLGALLHLGGIVGATRLGFALTGCRAAGAAAGTLMAAATPVAAAAFSGMEVALAGTLTLFAMDAVARRRWSAAGWLLALAALARPEAAVLSLLAATLVTPRRTALFARLLLPPVFAAALVAAHHLGASGSALPATFHAKAAVSLAALPHRLVVVLRDMMPGIPPFAAGLGWIALLGLATRRDLALPFLAGAALLLANLVLIDPVDPAAFYHLRYVLPALPLLLVALAVGARALGDRLRGRLVYAPLAVLLALAAAGAATTAGPVSRHLHNDVRNINEVQRAIGEWLAANLPAGTRVAASDAGAVRYFSRLPVIDVLGLNTPQMLANDEGFLSAHPVGAVVLMPAWFRPADGAGPLVAVFAAETADYTVTSNPQMARQVVLSAAPGATSRVRARFVGFRSFEVDVDPPGTTRRNLPSGT
ncbi:MAG: hypothetical protein ACT4PE_00905 [Candidatus Eiseniibacteriota bacterium]